MTRFSGVVKKHLGRGRQLGYPTANVDVPADFMEGTFVGWTFMEGQKWPSIVFIGAPETFNDTEKRAESHLLDFDADIYGKTIEIELAKKLRDNRKFTSKEELIDQMKIDEKNARDFFATIPKQ